MFKINKKEANPKQIKPMIKKNVENIKYEPMLSQLVL